MCIFRVIWNTAHNCGRPKCHSLTSSLSWKGKKFWPQHCLTKWALENKLLNQNGWSWYFSQEMIPQTLTPIIVSTYCRKYAVPGFFSGPPCIVYLTESPQHVIPRDFIREFSIWRERRHVTPCLSSAPSFTYRLMAIIKTKQQQQQQL